MSKKNKRKFSNQLNLLCDFNEDDANDDDDDDDDVDELYQNKEEDDEIVYTKDFEGVDWKFVHSMLRDVIKNVSIKTAERVRDQKHDYNFDVVSNTPLYGDQYEPTFEEVNEVECMFGGHITPLFRPSKAQEICLSDYKQISLSDKGDTTERKKVRLYCYNIRCLFTIPLIKQIFNKFKKNVI